MNDSPKVWSPEELGILEAKIDKARSGDIGEAASLLRLVIKILERELPFPEPLRQYLIAAFREITKGDSPNGIEVPPHPTFKNMSQLRENLNYLEATRDANAAFNLKRPRGRKHTAARATIERAALAMMVNHERENGKTFEEAVGAVADRMGISERTITRAWGKMKGPLYGDNK